MPEIGEFEARVTVHSATDVPKMDTFGWADPYVVLVTDRYGPCLITDAIPKEANPTWESECVCGYETVTLRLLDKDLFKDELIGEARVDMREPMQRAAIALKGPDGKPVPHTRVHISVVPQDKLAFMARLRRFFERYAPERLKERDRLWVNHSRSWSIEELMRELIERYGPEPPQAPFDAARTRSHLIEFFQHYAPDRLETVNDAFIDEFKGHEDACWTKLEKKYGQQPRFLTDAPPATPVNALELLDWRTRLELFYDHYAPDKKDSIGDALNAWSGREDEMMDALQKKYGPEPGSQTTSTPSSDLALSNPEFRERLVKFFETHAPEKVVNVDSMVLAYEGREDDLWSTLERNYGHLDLPASANPAASSSANAELRARLVRYFEHYSPGKLATVDVVVERFTGHEDVLWTKLANMYGPELK